MSELQAKFEAWCKELPRDMSTEKDCTGQYAEHNTRLTWYGYQAGAQAQASIANDADVNAPWLSLAHSICTDHGIEQGHIYARLCALRDKQSENGRSDQQIVDQTERLAKALAEYDGWQSTAPFKGAINPRAQEYWNRACLAQEILTATDVTNAVDSLDGELGTDQTEQQASIAQLVPIIRTWQERTEGFMMAGMQMQLQFNQRCMQEEIAELRSALSSQPEPVAHANDYPLEDWLAREMPAGTVIGDPAFWARKLTGRFNRAYNTGVADARLLAATSPIPPALIPQIVAALEIGYKAAVSHVKSFDPEINKLCQEEIVKLCSAIAALKQIGGS